MKESLKLYLQMLNDFFTGAKKLKKDTRKVPGFVADSLGPALFSTPDIIRRVGSNSDGKADNTATPTTPTTPSATVMSTPGSSTIPMSPVPSLDIGICAASNAAQNVASNFKKTVSNILDQSAETESQLNLNESSSVMPGDENEEKSEIKTPLEELQPSLDPGKTRSWRKFFINFAYPSRIVISIRYLFTSDFCKTIAYLLHFLVQRKMCHSNIF